MDGPVAILIIISSEVLNVDSIDDIVDSIVVVSGVLPELLGSHLFLSEGKSVSQFPLFPLEGDPIGYRTGNGEKPKLSNSQAEPGQDIKSAVA